MTHKIISLVTALFILLSAPASAQTLAPWTNPCRWPQWA